MYESPINVEWNHRLAEEAEEAIRKLMNDEEAHIMYKVNLVVDVDKDELLKALQYDRHQYEKGYADRDAELVRCKDCKHWVCGGIDDRDNFIPPRCTLFNEPQTSEWFCPEGQRE